MPWKSSTATATGSQKTMARSKPGSRSIRGQISAPKPLDNSLVAEFAGPNEIELSREQTHLSRTASSQVHADGQISHTNDLSPSTTTAYTHQGASQRVGFNDIDYKTSTPESGNRLSNVQTKAPPLRKRSPIRDALSRLFGRRKKTASQLTTVSEPPPQRTSAPLQQVKQNENAGRARGSAASRSVSLPVTEYDRALRSHSVGLDDVIAIQSARNSMAAERVQAKKRSGGSASPFLLGARYIGDGKLAGLCPRPASVNDKDLHGSTPVAEDPDEIGRAITSDLSGLRRRSRSMSALSFFEANQDDLRRRSEEMKDLRGSSHLSGTLLSPMSSVFPQEYAMDTFNLELPGPPCPPEPEPPNPEAFMFGNLISDDEAANRHQVDEEATLNTRVNGIENRLHVLEDSVSLLRYKSNPYTVTGWKPSDGTLAAAGLGIQTSFSYPTTTNHHYSLSMGIPQSTRPSTTNSEGVFMESTLQDGGVAHGRDYGTSQQPASYGTARPLSEHTLRGYTPNNSMQPQVGPILSGEHYTAILGLLEMERSARIALETQVLHLTRQLNMLLGKNASKSGYRTASGAPLVSAFDYDADESESLASSTVRYNVWHPQGYSFEDSGIDPGTSSQPMANEDGAENDNESSSQLYATPSEENHTFGVYQGGGGGNHDNNSADESGPMRALSLSRLTMGQMPTQTPVM